MVYVQLRICPGEWDAQTLPGVWDTHGSPNLGQTTGPCDNQRKRKVLPNCGLCCLADHRVNLKESEKRDKYLDLAREFKILWNMQMVSVLLVKSTNDW